MAKISAIQKPKDKLKKVSTKLSGKKYSKSEQSDLSLKLNQQIWPMERDILFRPDRLKYVRKLIQSQGCVFCTASQAEVSFETLCVYKTAHSMIVLNKFPYNPGHLMVLPMRHCGEFLQLSDEEYADFTQTIRIAFKALTECFNPEGINMGLNHGAVSGAGIPGHLHQHLVPRWFGDLNFFPLIADTKVVVISLQETYDRLERYFKNEI